MRNFNKGSRNCEEHFLFLLKFFLVVNPSLFLFSFCLKGWEGGGGVGLKPLTSSAIPVSFTFPDTADFPCPFSYLQSLLAMFNCLTNPAKKRLGLGGLSATGTKVTVSNTLVVYKYLPVKEESNEIKKVFNKFSAFCEEGFIKFLGE